MSDQDDTKKTIRHYLEIAKKVGIGLFVLGIVLFVFGVLCLTLWLKPSGGEDGGGSEAYSTRARSAGLVLVMLGTAIGLIGLLGILAGTVVREQIK